MENKHKQFNAFDKVLIRLEGKEWRADIYSHYSVKEGRHICIGLNIYKDENILPYEGNEHLVGTTDEPKVPLSEKEIQDAYWNNCTEKEKENLRKNYNTLLKEDGRGKYILEKTCGKHNLQDEQEEEIKLEEGEYIIVFLDTQHLPFNCCLRKFHSIGDEEIKASDNFNNGESLSTWPYCIKFSDFNPNDIEETKKHILCVKGGKIVKYKK